MRGVLCRAACPGGEERAPGQSTPPSCESIWLHLMMTGHSERRGLYGEDDRDMALKTKFGLDNGMSVMACIGESLVERKLNKTKMVNER